MYISCCGHLRVYMSCSCLDGLDHSRWGGITCLANRVPGSIGMKTSLLCSQDTDLTSVDFIVCTQARSLTVY